MWNDVVNLLSWPHYAATVAENTKRILLNELQPQPLPPPVVHSLGLALWLAVDWLNATAIDMLTR